MNEETEQKSNLEVIKDKVMHPNATSLSMARVPRDSVSLFRKYADEKFVGDYGLCFKHIIDEVLGPDSLKLKDVILMLQELETRIIVIEKSLELTQSNGEEQQKPTRVIRRSRIDKGETDE